MAEGTTHQRPGCNSPLSKAHNALPMRTTPAPAPQASAPEYRRFDPAPRAPRAPPIRGGNRSAARRRATRAKISRSLGILNAANIGSSADDVDGSSPRRLYPDGG